MELLDVIADVNKFLEQDVIFRGLKFILAVYLIILLLNIVLLLYGLLIKRRYWLDFSYGRTMPKIKGVMNKDWREVISLAKSGDKNDYKAAVVGAGDIVYKTFVKIGYPGNDLTEQLGGMIGYQIANLEDIKWADQIRRNILADVNYNLAEDTMQKVVMIFGKAVLEMEAIDDLLINEDN